MSTIMFDFDNLALRCFYGNKDVEPESASPNYDYWKYLVFNSIYRMLYKERIHEVILALDSPSWRKIVYPLYKAHRAKKKEESKVDWDLFHLKKNEFLDEIKTYLPIKVIGVNRAEADDILGTLINHKKTENAIVVSMDADYLQLSGKCRIYSPIKKEFVKVADPEKFLLYTSLCGQKKDNIFNVKTPHNWPDTKKKPPLGEKGIDKMILNRELDTFLDTPIVYEFDNEDGQKYSETVLPRKMYELNRKLIDFDCTPKVMSEKTLEVYENYKIRCSPEDVYTYINKMNWREMIENFTQVEGKMLELF